MEKTGGALTKHPDIRDPSSGGAAAAGTAFAVSVVSASYFSSPSHSGRNVPVGGTGEPAGEEDSSHPEEEERSHPEEERSHPEGNYRRWRVSLLNPLSS